MQQRISAQSIQTYARAIRAFFGFLYGEGFIDHNPMERVRMPKVPTKVVPTFTEIEAIRLLAQPDKHTDVGFRDCAKRADLPDLVNPETGRARGVSPHRLRDAFSVHAMKLDDSGDGLRLLQEHLGHASFNTTAKYRKIAGEEHRKWYESLWGETA